MNDFISELTTIRDEADWTLLLHCCIENVAPLIDERYREARFNFASTFAEIRSICKVGEAETALNRSEELHRLAKRDDLFMGRAHTPRPSEARFVVDVLAELAELSDTLLYGPVEAGEVQEACDRLIEARQRFLSASSGSYPQPPTSLP
ncbi:MAG: hypothetical protein PF961_06165 [Planctomycetota bacterium]|jgi:hypothetical protein|nr:hypothetical protein [Planctomycetota bacterium]